MGFFQKLWKTASEGTLGRLSGTKQVKDVLSGKTKAYNIVSSETKWWAGDNSMLGPKLRKQEELQREIDAQESEAQKQFDEIQNLYQQGYESTGLTYNQGLYSTGENILNRKPFTNINDLGYNPNQSNIGLQRNQGNTGIINYNPNQNNIGLSKSYNMDNNSVYKPNENLYNFNKYGGGY